MFVLIMISIYKHTYKRRGITTKESTLTFVRKNAVIAFSLAILFGLGWVFGLAASGSPSEEATFTLQLLFTIFVGCQGILIFVLHGIRKAEARNEWKKWLSIVIFRRSNGVKSPSTLPLSQHARSQVTSPSSSGYDMSTLSSLPNKTSSSTDAEKVEIPAKAEGVEFNGANEQRASRKQSLIQAVADVMNIPGKHAKYDMLKASESPPPKKKINSEDDSEGRVEACVPSTQRTRRVSAPEFRSASSESKQPRKHRMSLLTPISGKYDLTSPYSRLPPTDSDGMSLLECEEEEEEEEGKGEEVEGEEKVSAQPHATTTETAADSHASATAKD